MTTTTSSSSTDDSNVHCPIGQLLINNNSNNNNNNNNMALIESLLLDPTVSTGEVDNPTTTTTTSVTIVEPDDDNDDDDLMMEKALMIESTLENDTILSLQNVTFDPNFFDRVNLDGTSTSTSNSSNQNMNLIQSLMMNADCVVDDVVVDQVHPTLVDDDDLELQLLTRHDDSLPSTTTTTTSTTNHNQSSSSNNNRGPSGTFLNNTSSDLLVSSTTSTASTFNQTQQQSDVQQKNLECDPFINDINDGDETGDDDDIKFFSNQQTKPPSITLIHQQQQTTNVSPRPPQLSQAQQQQFPATISATMVSSHHSHQQQTQFVSGEKVYFTTTTGQPISLAQMKVLGAATSVSVAAGSTATNVLAIISDQQQDDPNRIQQPQQQLFVQQTPTQPQQIHHQSTSGGQRLIIIEDTPKNGPIPVSISELIQQQQQQQKLCKKLQSGQQILVSQQQQNINKSQIISVNHSNTLKTTSATTTSNETTAIKSGPQNSSSVNGDSSTSSSSTTNNTTTAATQSSVATAVASTTTSSTISSNTNNTNQNNPQQQTQQQQFTDADSNSGNPSSKAFVPCKVCGDKASGYHYGVTSCEGCKGFFRRSIQKQIEYRCLRDGKCLIIRLNRNRCQYCRFKKCLAVGMSRDSVRYGRVPKKSKEKERMDEKSRVTQAEADQSSNGDNESKDLACYEIALTISQAHHDNCSYTNEKIKGINKKPIFLLSSQLKNNDTCSSPDIGSVSESLEAQKIELWEHLALLITPCIQRVVEFAKRIPGFSELTQDDQLILIKLGFFEVWLVHISKTVDFIENTLTFADGSFLSRRQLELMFNHEFVGNLFHLMSGLNSLNLTDEEVALFSAIIILQSDRPQIYDVKSINKIQETIVAALKFQINKHRDNDSMQTFQKLMMKINELRALGSSHLLHLQWFRTNWSRLKLPPLFAEIFDIPKLSQFSQQSTNNSNNDNNTSANNSQNNQIQIQAASTTQTIIKTEPFEAGAGVGAVPMIDNNQIVGQPTNAN